MNNLFINKIIKMQMSQWPVCKRFAQSFGCETLFGKSKYSKRNAAIYLMGTISRDLFIQNSIII